MESSPKRVLVVEDDADTRELVVEILTGDGLAVRACDDGEQALAALQAEPFDLVLADIKMPGLTGTDLLFEMRHLELTTPVILMTAFASLETAVQALRGSAFDYVSKPFTVLELRRRVLAALNAPPRPLHPRNVYRYGEIELDEDAHKAWKGRAELALTPLEFSVLAHLMRFPGRAVPTDELLQDIWKAGAGAEERTSNTVKSCIFRLRDKIEDDPRRPRYILNVWGVGYQFGQ